MFILIIAIILDLASVLFNIVHLTIYAYDGRGVLVLSIVSRFTKIIAQLSTMWLLLMLAFGWTITYRNVTDVDMFITGIVFVVMMHVMAVGLSYIGDDQYHKFHDFGGFQGFILVALRVFMYFAFLYGCYETEKSKLKANQASFLKKLKWSATLYILAFPIMWFV